MERLLDDDDLDVVVEGENALEAEVDLT